MKIAFVLLSAALWVPAELWGCASAHAAPCQNSQVTVIAYQKEGMGHRIKEDARDTTDALGITPRVKGAIIADSQLNDRRNHINVATKDFVLHIRGHVYSQAIKARAGMIAARKLKKMHKNYQVSNELTIVKSR